MASGTASGILDGIITNITATSVMGANSACTAYDVLESTSVCCGVVGWQAHLSAPITMGTNKERKWTHVIELFIKDQSEDPTGTMNKVTQLIDKVVSSLESDDTVQGTVDTVMEIRAGRSIGEALSVGGATWLPSIIEIDTLSLPE